MGAGGGCLSEAGERLRGVAYGSRGVDDAGPWQRGGVFVNRDGPIPVDAPEGRVPVERQWRLRASRRDDVAHGGQVEKRMPSDTSGNLRDVPVGVGLDGLQIPHVALDGESRIHTDVRQAEEGRRGRMPDPLADPQDARPAVSETRLDEADRGRGR